jgi:hypothetical protein
VIGSASTPVAARVARWAGLNLSGCRPDLAGRVRERRLKHAYCEADRERVGRGLVGAMNVRAGFAFGVSACVPLGT